MKYKDVLKKVDVSNTILEIVELDLIKAQYNPDRFSMWKSLHKGPDEEVLNMKYSPHYNLLLDISNWKDSSYYEMHRLYGRKHAWIEDKVTKFIELFYNITKEGYKENIIVLRRPLVANPYNNSYEIYEGHHRVACVIMLNI